MSADEAKTIRLLLSRGHSVELIPISRIKGVKTPDILLDGIPWEIKNPHVSTTDSLRHLMWKASKQSHNVIFDLRRLKQQSLRAASTLEHLFANNRDLRRLKNHLV
ncbi:hypothetical protein IJJ12_00175 [bacterium]|nr:hypothetical protein [bacterium]